MILQEYYVELTLIYSSQHQHILRNLKQQMFTELEAKGGMYIPLYSDRGGQFNHRDSNRSHAADFPPEFYSKPHPNGQEQE